MGQLAAFHQYLEICATAQEFVAKCSSAQYEVAILPTGILPQDDRSATTELSDIYGIASFHRSLFIHFRFSMVRLG
jgi:hypothetical protein